MDSPIFGMSMDGRPCNLKFLLWGNNQYNEPRYYFCSSFKSLVLEPTNMMVVSVVWTFHLLHIRQKHPSTERRSSLATPSKIAPAGHCGTTLSYAFQCGLVPFEKNQKSICTISVKHDESESDQLNFNSSWTHDSHTFHRANLGSPTCF
jgi:hypothetical protein